MAATSSVPVLVVGAGPVGLALANDLGMRGIRCVVVDRAPAISPLPKMNLVNARSMELCRRWGLADAVRGAGWPDDYPLDVAYVTSLTGYEITRFALGSQRDRPPSDDTPEPSQRCPQIWFDPILERGLGRFACVELRRGCELVGFRDTGDRVVATLRDGGGGEQRLEADYLVGADGAASVVRESAGIERESWGPSPHQVAIALRARDFWGFCDKRRAAFYWVLDGQGARGVVTPTDGSELWRFNWNLRPGESPDAFDPHHAIRTLAGADFDYEIVAVMPWQIRFTLAHQYRRGRVFLAGDAARTLSPTGGLGMNTGLADAADLGWKLAARLEGWGGEALLDSYDAERRDAGRQMNDESLRNLGRVAAIPRVEGIAATGARGDALRAEAGRALDASDARLEFHNEGAVLGLHYADSPVLVPDGEPPVYDPNAFRAVCAVGCRAPHVALVNGDSILDRFGRGFTLLCVGAEAAAVAPLERAAAERSVPLQVERVCGPAVEALYGTGLVLVRPDGVVAWRGALPPGDSPALLDVVRGATC